MTISKVSTRQSFGNLYYTNDLKGILVDEKTSPKFLREFAKIRSITQNTGAEKKKYVDVILHYDDGFYGVISSKKQGTPYHPDSKCKISSKKEDIKNFVTWVNSWNYDYSPKGLAEFEKLKQDALKCMKNYKKNRKNVDYLV